MPVDPPLPPGVSEVCGLRAQEELLLLQTFPGLGTNLGSAVASGVLVKGGVEHLQDVPGWR